MAASTHSTDLERGSTQYWFILDASQTGLDITGDMTLMTWLKPESQPAADQPNSIYSKYLPLGNQRAIWLYYQDSAGTKRLNLNISADGSAVTTKTLDTTLSNATWYHFAMVYTAAAGTADFYTDGASIGQMTGLPTSIFNSTASARIGGEPEADGFTWDGLFDDYMIFNAALTEAQIDTYLADECGWTPLASLQARWLFNNNADDETANNNDLTASVSSPTFTTDVAYTCSTGSAQAGFLSLCGVGN